MRSIENINSCSHTVIIWWAFISLAHRPAYPTCMCNLFTNEFLLLFEIEENIFFLFCYMQLLLIARLRLELSGWYWRKEVFGEVVWPVVPWHPSSLFRKHIHSLPLRFLREGGLTEPEWSKVLGREFWVCDQAGGRGILKVRKWWS